MESGLGSVSVTGIQFKSSIWTAIDIQITFTNCELNELIINIARGQSNGGVQLHISGSQIGSLISIKNTVVLLENCTSSSTKIQKNQALIDAVNSTVIVKSLHVEMLQGGGFLQVKTGTVGIEDSKFISCTSAIVLISILDDSIISVDNCTFTSNDGHLVNLAHSSIGLVNNSMFNNNVIVNNSTEFLSFLLQVYLHSIMFLEKSLFVKNEAQFGALLLILKSIGVVQNSHFTWNSGDTLHGVIHTLNASTLRINGSIFSNNKCGGVSAINSPSVIMSSSLFHNNTATKGGGFQSDQNMEIDSSVDFHEITRVLARYQLANQNQTANSTTLVHLLKKQDARIHNCTFSSNTAEMGGAISTSNLSLTLVDSKFINNSALGLLANHRGCGGAVSLVFSPTNITGCLFSGNEGSFGGGVDADGDSLQIYSTVLVNNQCIGREAREGGAVSVRNTYTAQKHLLIVNTTFQANSAQTGGAISSAASNTTIHSSSFRGNKAKQGGAVVIFSAKITNAIFESNTANRLGGALFIVALGSQVTVSHTKFAVNEAGTGGAVYGVGLSCYNCSFNGNTAGFR